MTVSVQVRFDEAKQFFTTTHAPADKKVILSFEDDGFDFIQQLRKQHALHAIQSFCGSGAGGSVDELLQERQQDRKRDC